MAEKFANNFSTLLNGAINNSVTSLVVDSVTGAPAVNWRLKIDDELMLVTAVSTLTLTVTRGIEGTTAASHADDSVVTHVLTAGALDQAIGAGTSFPGSPLTSDRYFRTDRGLHYYYDGTRWLTVNEYEMGIGWAEAAAALSATTTVARWPVRQDYGIYLTRWNVVTFQTNGTPASNNMTVVLARVNASNTANTIASFVTSSDTASNWVNHDQTINDVLDSSARSLRVVATEAGTVTGFIVAETVAYRLIG